VDSALDDRNIAVLKFLVVHGANINRIPQPDGTQDSSWKPQIPAFEAMQPKGMKLHTADTTRAAFVALGGDINQRNPKGNSWLMESLPSSVAYSGDVMDALGFLAAHKFDFNAVNSDGETAIILYAKRACGAEGAAIVAFIRAHGGRTSVKDKSGHSAEDYAVLTDCAPMLAALK
jgi:hypothetical protein